MVWLQNSIVNIIDRLTYNMMIPLDDIETFWLAQHKHQNV